MQESTCSTGAGAAAGGHLRHGCHGAWKLGMTGGRRQGRAQDQGQGQGCREHVDVSWCGWGWATCALAAMAREAWAGIGTYKHAKRACGRW